FAYSMLLAEHPRSAIDALDLALASEPANRSLYYWRALAQWGISDTLAAIADFRRAGGSPARASGGSGRSTPALATPTASLRRVAELIGYRDAAALDPWVHARLAALCLAIPSRHEEGVIEAYAFRLLSPTDPDAWRKWASAQLGEKQYEAALRSLEQYLAL